MVSLGASALLGVGALIVARIWIPQTQHNAPSMAAVEPAGVPVVVAAADIPYGTKLDAGKLTVVRMPAASAPKGAYADPGQILRQTGGPPIALQSIVAHEPILAGKLSGPGARPILAATIDEGMRAYTVGVTEVAGGGGHIMPGDRVDVLLTHDISPPGSADAGHNMVTDVVLQNVSVLGMDLNVDPTSTTAAAAHTATMEVSVQDAERLALAAQAGGLSMALRGTGNAEVSPVRTIATNELRSMGPHGLVGGGRPAGPARHAAPAARPVTRHTVIVVHGDATSSVEVPQERYGAGA